MVEAEHRPGRCEAEQRAVTMSLMYVVTVVVLTSPSGNANTGGQMPQRDAEFHVVLIADESGVSVSPRGV